MQKKHISLEGFRLLAWGAILLALLAIGTLLLDTKKAPVTEPQGAVLVCAGVAA